jgi:hypothetical protein
MGAQAEKLNSPRFLNFAFCRLQPHFRRGILTIGATRLPASDSRGKATNTGERPSAGLLVAGEYAVFKATGDGGAAHGAGARCGRDRGRLTIRPVEPAGRSKGMLTETCLSACGRTDCRLDMRLCRDHLYRDYAPTLRIPHAGLVFSCRDADLRYPVLTRPLLRAFTSARTSRAHCRGPYPYPATVRRYYVLATNACASPFIWIQFAFLTEQTPYLCLQQNITGAEELCVCVAPLSCLRQNTLPATDLPAELFTHLPLPPRTSAGRPQTACGRMTYCSFSR